MTEIPISDNATEASMRLSKQGKSTFLSSKVDQKQPFVLPQIDKMYASPMKHDIHIKHSHDFKQYNNAVPSDINMKEALKDWLIGKSDYKIENILNNNGSKQHIQMNPKIIENISDPPRIIYSSQKSHNTSTNNLIVPSQRRPVRFKPLSNEGQLFQNNEDSEYFSGGGSLQSIRLPENISALNNSSDQPQVFHSLIDIGGPFQKTQKPPTRARKIVRKPSIELEDDSFDKIDNSTKENNQNNSVTFSSKELIPNNSGLNKQGRTLHRVTNSLTNINIGQESNRPNSPFQKSNRLTNHIQNPSMFMLQATSKTSELTSTTPQLINLSKIHQLKVDSEPGLVLPRINIDESSIFQCKNSSRLDTSKEFQQQQSEKQGTIILNQMNKIGSQRTLTRRNQASSIGSRQEIQTQDNKIVPKSLSPKSILKTKNSSRLQQFLSSSGSKKTVIFNDKVVKISF